MAIISLQGVSIGFRGPNLLDDVHCQVEAGGRIGLLGRNGAGKSTLLKMIRGDIQPDHGTVTLANSAQASYLQQDVPQCANQTVTEVVAAGLGDLHQGADLGWEAEHMVAQTLSQMELDPAALVETLSSGMKRRVLLARAIASRPEVLLLDEPTNHLDIEAIRWLERFLLSWLGTLIFVTHDRMFLRTVATRILEIDRGRLFDWSCDYDTFLRRKDGVLAAQEKQDALFDKKLAKEEAWIRQGIKARRTRNEGRVRSLKKMREQRRLRRDEPGVAQMTIQSGKRSGALVAELKNVTFAYPDQPILNDFSTMIMRGDKIGIMGPNGAGKTTLLKILLGELQPDCGSVRTGTNLAVSYFDQLRDQLNEDETIEQNVGRGRASISVGGKEKHIIGYLQEFLFSPDQARTMVKFLSGGERNRVLLARLFARAANVIVLDEPTNDLDTETLEMLESKLVDYDGTILLVSHDRTFLNNVVSSTIVFESQGVREYVGGYDDWLAQRPSAPDVGAVEQRRADKDKRQTGRSAGKKKLNYKEQRELEALPQKIESLETRAAQWHLSMAEPGFYQRSSPEIAADQQQLHEIEAQLAAAYARWEELECSLEGNE
ncbi:MAG: ATP-binding cassette domain-containing protein [Pirellulales bacterium]|nr:ATP-binding cassette domain-containing protein [Pirellulales bacterium]